MRSGDEDSVDGVIIELIDDEPSAPAAVLPPRVAAAGAGAAARGPSLVRVREESHRDGMRTTLRQILPALDSLEACYREASSKETLQQGVRMALRALWDVFRAHDLERIEGDGIAFDPALHEAVQVTPTDRVAPGTVLEVLRVGYTLGGELVRPAMVRVSIAPGGGRPGQPLDGEGR